jgi:6-phosphofructokinase 2
VACHFTHIAGETRTNIIVQDESTGEETPLLARGPRVQPSELVDLIDHLEGLNDVEFLVVSGSLPPGLTPAVYRRIIEIGTARGARVLLDTSGDGLSQGILARPSVIKPNHHELEELAGSTLPDLAAVVGFARTLNDRVPTVLVSMGPDGIVLVRAGHALHARPPRIDVRSTVGAGDCAVAGFVHGLMTRVEPAECLRLAVAAGTAATLCPGTGLCRRPDIDALLPQVSIREVAA